MVSSPSRVRDVFLAAADLPPGDRPAYLAAACGPDPALRAAIDRLLAAHARPDRLLDRPPVLFGCTDTAADPDVTLTRTADDTPVPARAVPTVLGGYRVERLLGEGGMGAVYLAHDDRLGRSVALKTMRPDVAAAPGAADRFVREARAAAQVAHDNVVPIWQVGEDAGVPFIAMPALDGEPLDRVLRRHPVCPVDLVLKVGCEVAQGLAAAHARGLVHRDVKPANVWVEGDPAAADPLSRCRRVRVLDFGLARPATAHPTADGAAAGGLGSGQTAGGDLTADGTVVGTPAYMSPEQARGEPLDARTDLFSLGVVLYRMATGEQPFRGATAYAVLSSLANAAPGPPAAANPAVPAALSALILRLLAKDPDDRPASAAAVAAELREVANRLHPAPPAPAPVVPPPAAELTVTQPASATADHRSRRRGRRWWVAAGLAGLLLALGGAAAAYRFEFTTKDGTLVVEVDGDADARFRNGELRLYDPAGNLKYTLTPGERNAKLAAGSYGVRVRGADGVALDTSEFTMTRDGRVTIRVTAKPAAPPEPPKVRVTTPYPPPVTAEEAAVNRTAVMWALSLGGRVRVDDWGYWLTAAELPTGPFRLTGVELSGCGQVSDGTLSNFSKCRHLTYLDLSRTSVGDAGVARLRDLTGLTYLQLYLTRVTDRGLPDLARLPRLRSVLLAATGVTDAGLAVFNGRTGLAYLDLGGTRATDAGLAHFAACKELVYLNLNGTPVTDAGVEPFGRCDGLETLLLTGTRVADAGLAHFRNCRQLRSVAFRDTKLTDAGLAHLRGCTRLTTVVVENTAVTDAGLAHLKGCRNLRHVDLRGTGVTDAGVAFLAEYRAPGPLFFNRTKVSGGMVEKLKRVRPQCWIEWGDDNVYMPPTEADRKAAVAVLDLGGTIRTYGLEPVMNLTVGSVHL